MKTVLYSRCSLVVDSWQSDGESEFSQYMKADSLLVVHFTFLTSILLRKAVFGAQNWILNMTNRFFYTLIFYANNIYSYEK
ncbi:hypothetical protein BH11PAT1_BH11PAT1_6860 [soil metagenome]